MYKKKLDEDIRCPLEYARQLIGGKWKIRIVCLLGNIGSLRFGELKSELIDISDGVLGLTLNELSKSDLIYKDNDVYKLTQKGNSVIPIFRELCMWSGKYYKVSKGVTMAYCKKCDYYKEWSASIGYGKTL